MNEPKDAKDRLQALMNALADRLESLNDSQILDDAASMRVDVPAEANRIRDCLSAAVLRTKV